ncbi:MAG: hypothetical protein EPO06_07275 [Burkholderiaceae bacterium]|nr:MAG: hypothetical protein EPO06_07275 [Burkholderiaceae bacterium]
MKLRVASYNIHKGVFRPLGEWRERVSIHALRERLHAFDADLIFLQEVQGQHVGQAARHADWPQQPHYEYLAQDTPYHVVYGQNLVHRHGDHGNVLLSRYPILDAENLDISDHSLEKRGLLHCRVNMDGVEVHCLVVHFGLFAASRRRQNAALVARIQQHVPAGAPLIVAGDFNDWRNDLNHQLHETLSVREVFNEYQPPGLWRSLIPQLPPAPWAERRIRPARSFPSVLPMLRLDRMYQRGFCVQRAEVLRGAPWRDLSDHCPLLADLECLT